MSLKILVVGTSEADHLIIKNTLSKYCVLAASDSFEAIRQIEMHRDVDLIILDLNMPNMDGFQLLNTLNSDERYKKMRIIIVTNDDELENEIKGLKLGATDYIRKPIQDESLKARIEMHSELLEQQIFISTIFEQAPIGIAISYSNEPFIDENKGHCVIAEGVEYERQKQYLLNYGCDKIQGYLISKPLDEAAALELLRKQPIINNDCHSDDNRA